MTEMHIIRKLPWNTLLKCQRKYFSQALRQNSRCMCTMKPPGERSKEMIDERDPKLCIPKGILGQPTCHTHPHLIKKGFLTCGITQMEYKERRDTLVNTLVSEVENDHICHFIVIPAAQKQYMSDKIPYVFRQNSDFFYLTGCMEPEAVLVIEKLAQSSNYKTIMFVHEKDKYAELWEGPRTGCHAALELFAVDESRPVETFSNYINKMKTTRASIVWYQNEGCANPELSAPIGAAVAGGRVTRACPQRALHGMRVRKSPAEIELMQRTCDIGARAINTAMACTKPGRIHTSKFSRDDKER